MPATLCAHPPDQPAMLRLLSDTQPEVCIGRGDDCAIALAHASVSRRHAALRFDGSVWWIEDLGSTNGVRIGGHRIERQQLRHGVWFSLGDVFCEFRIADAAELSAQSRRAEQRRQASGGWLGRIAGTSDRDALLAGLMSAIVELSDCRRGFLLAGDLEHGLTTAACYAMQPDTASGDTFAGSTGAIARALHTRRPLLVSNPSALDWARGRPSIVEQELRALIVLPILHRDQMLGVAYADSDVPGKFFTELDHDILQAFTEEAALLLIARGLDASLAHITACVETDASGQPRRALPAARWMQPA